MENIGLILSQLEDILLPLGICVALPVMIVWLVMRKKTNETNRRTEIVLAAIEKNSEIDVEDFFKKMNPAQKTLKEKLMQRFQWGAVLVALGVALMGYVLLQSLFGGANPNQMAAFSLGGVVACFVGAAFLITYRVSRNVLAKELEEESKGEAQ